MRRRKTRATNLYLVRHGESERNFLTRLFAEGKKAEAHRLHEKMRGAHTSFVRLTPTGVAQAKIAGQWIQNDGIVFDHFVSSGYTRARETAGHLGLKDACWSIEPLLGERSQGVLENLTLEERLIRYEDTVRTRELHEYYGGFPGGESMNQVVQRWMLVHGMLYPRFVGRNTIAVLHGETMWGIRLRMEGITPDKFRMLLRSDNQHDKIHNCQIFHYSMNNPKTGEDEGEFNWVRSICPWDETLSSNVWRRIERPTYSNDDLIRKAERKRRYIHE